MIHLVSGFTLRNSLCKYGNFQQFGKILDVEIIFNERGSKVSDHPGQKYMSKCTLILF